jgi:hypothetical protein
MEGTHVSHSLRPILRSLLATQPPSISAAFTNIARSRLQQTESKTHPNDSSFFMRHTHNSCVVPTQQLLDTLSRVRSLYGVGLGFASLRVLASVVYATIGLRWESDGVMADILAVIDADIGQAIQASVFSSERTGLIPDLIPPQSSKEEIEAGRIRDFVSAREVVSDLRTAVNQSIADTRSWGGEFPFERASFSIQYWKI